MKDVVITNVIAISVKIDDDIVGGYARRLQWTKVIEIT